MTKTASESELTARAQQPDKPTYKVVEHDEGTATLELDDGRVVHASVPENVKLKKGDKVAIKSDGEDAGGAPLNVEVVRVL